MNNRVGPTKTPSALISCTIEAYTEGDGSRAQARARLREIRPEVFTVVPFYLREVSGPDVGWSLPERGSAIQTTSPITNFDEAHGVLAWWATQTYALRRRL